MDRERAVPVELVRAAVPTGDVGAEPQEDVAVAVRAVHRRGSRRARLDDRRCARGDGVRRRRTPREVPREVPAGAGHVGGRQRPGEFDLRTVENRDAVAAGVENLLLGATAAGLASFWSSGVPPGRRRGGRARRLGAGTIVVAIVYLGGPTARCGPRAPDSRGDRGPDEIGPTITRPPICDAPAGFAARGRVRWCRR